MIAARDVLTAASISSCDAAPAGRADLILRRVLPDGRASTSGRRAPLTAALVGAKRPSSSGPGSTLRFVSRPTGASRRSRVRPPRPEAYRTRGRGPRRPPRRRSHRSRGLSRVDLARGAFFTARAAGRGWLRGLQADVRGRSRPDLRQRITVGDGECIHDGRRPRVRAAIRAADAQLFDRVRTIASPPFTASAERAAATSARLLRRALPGGGRIGPAVADPPVGRCAERHRFTARRSPLTHLTSAVPVRVGLLALARAPGGARGRQPSVLAHPARLARRCTRRRRARAQRARARRSRHPASVGRGTSLKVARDPGA